MHENIDKKLYITNICARRSGWFGGRSNEGEEESSGVEPMSKRKAGFPSEAHVTLTGGKTQAGVEFQEKLGRHDMCPCGSGRPFNNCCMGSGQHQVGEDYER